MPAMTKHAAGTVSWVDLMAWDLPKAQDFYGALFGWTFQEGSKENGHYTMAFKGAHPVAALMPRPSDAPFPPIWNTYFAVESVDRSVARLKELGGKVMMEPMDVMDAGRMAFCTDNTGAPFGFWQPNQFHGSGLVNEPGAMAWFEGKTHDGAKAVAFYKDLFGMTADKMPDDRMQYWVLKKDGSEAAGVMQLDDKTSANVPAHWMITFSVANTDEAATTVSAKGGKVIMQPFDSPYGRIAIVADPGGAAFGIITLARPA
ncbi:VOC family protein [Corallococcus interemptor]|uniref:VOC family protein n=2 Tax=Corallococcus interemptor TaxID=2316720 RepID=A0A3A8QAG0_9BACT|nr:VOC family protein [Corallococcus interemptor]